VSTQLVEQPIRDEPSSLPLEVHAIGPQFGAIDSLKALPTRADQIAQFDHECASPAGALAPEIILALGPLYHEEVERF
jgi:hypothetical protein